MQTRIALLPQMGIPRPYTDTLPLQITDAELDPPGPEEVCVRILAAGVCHSDLSVINGDRPRPTPIALGHEGVAEVVRCGEMVGDL